MNIERSGLFILFGGAFLVPITATIGSLAVMVAFLFSTGDRRVLARQPAVQVALACTLYLLFLTTTLFLIPPSNTPAHWEEAFEWIQLLLFIPVAHLLSRHREDLPVLLLLALAGLLVRMLGRLDWDHLANDPAGYFELREGFGFPALAFALYCGSALLGLMTLRMRFWTWPFRRAADYAWFLLWLTGLLTLFATFIWSQARGTWLSFIAAVLAAGYLSRKHRKEGAHPHGMTWVVTAIGLLLLALLASPQRGLVVHRIVAEIPKIEAMVRGDDIDVADSSVALRWNAQVFGLQTWLERPFTGWGPRPSEELMRASGNPNLIIETGEVLSHLHNTYLEILVQTGLIGLCLAGVLMASLIRGLHTAQRSGRVAPDIYTFLLSTLILLLLWCLFDYRAVHQDWRIFWTLLAGTILGLSLPQAHSVGQKKTRSSEAAPQTDKS